MRNLSEVRVGPSNVGMMVTRLYSSVHVGSAFGVAVEVSDIGMSLNDSILGTAFCGIEDPVLRILKGWLIFLRFPKLCVFSATF